MSEPDKRYPLSSPEGRAIPLEIIRPYGCLTKSFTAIGSTASITIPAEISIMSVLADEDCIIQFATSSASAEALVDGTVQANAAFVPAGIIIVLSPAQGLGTFAIRGIANSGSAKIQYIDRWAGLALASQFIRR